MRKFIALLAVGLVVVLSTTAMAGIGEVRYYPMHPAPEIFTPDGLDDDWGWYPEEFLITGADMADRYNASWDQSDFAPAVYMAWTPEPDNRWYVLFKFIDDTLYVAPENFDDIDGMQFYTDMDMGGGSILGVSGTIQDILNGQRWMASPNPAAGPYADSGYWLEDDKGEMMPALCAVCVREGTMWAYEWPILQAGWSTHGAQPGDTDVTWAIEFSWAAYDVVDATEDVSVRHQFVEGDEIGFSWRFHDADGPAGRKHWLYPIDGSLTADVDADAHNIWMAVDADIDPITAVEHTTWGAVKAFAGSN
jgi:hypothetical protein